MLENLIPGVTNMKLRTKSLARIKMVPKMHGQACFSARAEIPFQLHEIFSDFSAYLAGLKMLG